MFRKTDDEKFEKHYQKAYKADPVAAEGALKGTQLIAEGRKATSVASADALKWMMGEILPNLIDRTKEQKIKFLLEHAKELGMMQKLSDTTIPDIYNDMYDKLGKGGLNHVEVDLLANLFLMRTIKNIVKETDNG